MTKSPIRPGSCATELGSVIVETLLENPDAECIAIDDVTHNRGSLIKRIADVQCGLHKLGVSRSDRVLCIGGPSLDFYALLVAGVLGSCVPAFLSSRINDAGAMRILASVAPTAILDVGEGVFDMMTQPIIRTDSFRPRWKEPQAMGEPAGYLSMSSGSLGHPSLSLVDDHGMASFLTWAVNELNVSAADRWLEPNDPTSDLSLTNALLVLKAGAKLIVPSAKARLFPARVAQAHEVTAVRATPGILRLLARDALRRKIRIPTLKLLAFGGDLLGSQLPLEIATSLGCRPRAINTYGKTEVAGFISYYWFDPLGSQAANLSPNNSISIGWPVPGVDVVLRDPLTGLEGARGEILVKSERVAVEVSTTPRDTGRSQLVQRKTSGGKVALLSTGDYALAQDDGMYFVGRLDRRVKIGGDLVNLESIEDILTTQMGAQVCVVTAPAGLVALIEAAQGPGLDDRFLAATAQLPIQYAPTKAIAVDQMPRTRSGKVDVRVCEEIARDLGSRR